jgi:hypothetical protein
MSEYNAPGDVLTFVLGESTGGLMSAPRSCNFTSKGEPFLLYQQTDTLILSERRQWGK